MGYQVILPPFIKSMHGKPCKKEDLHYYTRYSKTFAKILPYLNPAPTVAQKACRNAFKEANSLAWNDMRDKETKQNWETIAALSNGEYNSARGAAFAHHYALIKQQIKAEELTQTQVNIKTLVSIIHPQTKNYKQHTNRQYNSTPIVLKHKRTTPIYHQLTPYHYSTITPAPPLPSCIIVPTLTAKRSCGKRPSKLLLADLQAVLA